MAKPKKQYSDEFKDQALAKVYSRGQRLIQEIADELNRSVHTLKTWMSNATSTNNVKGCRMPALHRKIVLQRRKAEGRRRTSLEGGNRGPRSGELGLVTVYGDLKRGWVADAVKSPKRRTPVSSKYPDFTLVWAIFSRLADGEFWLFRNLAKRSRGWRKPTQ
jgi:transposase-like protein